MKALKSLYELCICFPQFGFGVDMFVRFDLVLVSQEGGLVVYPLTAAFNCGESLTKSERSWRLPKVTQN